MQGLVVPHPHTKPSAETTSHQCHAEECRLGYAPPCVAGLPLIDAEEKKCDDIDSDKINNDDNKEPHSVILLPTAKETFFGKDRRHSP